MTPFGVQRRRNEFTVLYIQLSIAQNRFDGCDSMLPPRPKFVVNSSFLSATPSAFVSVYFQISSLFVSAVRMAFAPNGIAKRGNSNLSTNTV